MKFPPSIALRWLTLCLVACFGATLPATERAAGGSEQWTENWTEFRGTHGDGWARGSDLPLEWSETKNIKWKTEIHGKGWSSPVIWGQQIWLTTATDDGKQMFALAIDRETGDVIHDILVFENENPQFCHPTNSYASPTPAIEAGRVYVHFGSYGTACLDTATGERLWQRRDLPCDHWRGPGSSPILHNGRLYVAFDGYDLQYVVALNQVTGATVWRKDRDIDYGTDDGDLKKAYCTCHVITHQGRAQLISPAAVATIAYDPETGQELWRVRHGGMNTSTRPVYSQGLVFVTLGDSAAGIKSALLAIRPEGTGDITNDGIAWSLDTTPPKRPSPQAVDDLLFTINDDGVVMCLEADRGKVLWRKRLPGNYRASPIYAGGRLYFSNLEGQTTVVAAERTYRELATNTLDNGCQASPAAHGDTLFLRTTRHLYAIAQDGSE